jgi:hypothetical protein
VLQTPQEQEKLFAKSEVPSAAAERLRKALVEKEAKIAWEMNSTGRVPCHPRLSSAPRDTICRPSTGDSYL